MKVSTCYQRRILIQDTRRRILNATLKLIRQRGFKGTTTRAIAEEAGVNEVTIFRHFKNKQGIVKAAFAKKSYANIFSKVIREEVVWDLEKDLLMLAKVYQELLNENRDLIMISLKEAEQFPELEREVINVPQQIKHDLVGYFRKMKEKGKLIETNLEVQALVFIWMNFSYFTNHVRYKTKVTELSIEEFLRQSIHVFARGLTP